MSGLWHSLGELTSSSFNAVGPTLVRLILIALSVVVAFLAVVLTWVLRPIFSEYVKLWHFQGIPPWRVVRTSLSQMRARENALKAREAEIEEHQVAVAAALARAEALEITLLSANCKVAELESKLLKYEQASWFGLIFFEAMTDGLIGAVETIRQRLRHRDRSK